MLDPFVGGGTSLVEARLLARPAVGADLSPLATFVSKVKVRPMTARGLDQVREWVGSLDVLCPLFLQPQGLTDWLAAGYLRNVDDHELVPVRLALAQALETLDLIEEPAAARFARCSILRTGQWALDMRHEVPSAEAVLASLQGVALAMITAAEKYARDARLADASYKLDGLSRRTNVLTQGLPGLSARLAGRLPPPRLVLTSPPYPGVYVNYHRWKVRGRRETPAPFWIAAQHDGNGLAYYTMSARSDRTLASYFRKLERSFSDLRALCDENTLVVQIVGFHDPGQDLPRYLATLDRAGFVERTYAELSTGDDGRLWRKVPNRRWWATNAPEYHTAREVVLLHALK